MYQGAGTIGVAGNCLSVIGRLLALAAAHRRIACAPSCGDIWAGLAPQ